MAEKLKALPKQLLERWNKFTGKQKTLIISVVCIVVFAFALLIFLIQKVEYKKLKIAETATEANEVVKVLESEGISYKYDDDTMTFYVDEKVHQEAYFALIDNNIPTTGVSIDDLLNNSLSTTNADRTLKINLYFQNQLRSKIMDMVGVDNAEVYYIPQEKSNTIFADAQDTSASVLLTVNDDFKIETAETIAEIVASVIGNEKADKIRVADQNGNLLYGGGQDLYSGTAKSDEDYKERLRNTFINNLYMGLIKSGFDDVEIMPNLTFDMKKVEQMLKEYLPAEGQEQGVYSHSYTYSSENAGYSGGVPGTSSNDDTDYMLEDSNSSTGSVEIAEYDYLPNERVTNTVFEVGAVLPEQSSISIVLKKITTVKEEELKLKGELEDMTFDEYILNTEASIPITVDPKIYELVQNATGISQERMTINAMEQLVFVPEVKEVRGFTDYLQIALAVLIIGLLAFVVFKGIAPVEVTEMEPELSVEQLLATTKENQDIEDIEFNEVSEVRRMIEKFVDEKPEAVAQLLRNWLNEDWN